MHNGIEELSLIDTDYYWQDTLIASIYDAWHGHADQIVERCRHLERIGVPISAAAATTYWTWFQDLPGNHSYKPLLIALVGARIYEHQDGRQLAFVHMDARKVAWFDGQSWQRFPLLEDGDGELIDQRWHHLAMEQRGFMTAHVFQPRFKDASSASSGGMTYLFLRYAVPKDFFDPNYELTATR